MLLVLNLWVWWFWVLVPAELVGLGFGSCGGVGAFWGISFCVGGII